jgi:hypothetical protein
MLVVVNALHNNPVAGDGMNLLVNLSCMSPLNRAAVPRPPLIQRQRANSGGSRLEWYCYFAPLVFPSRNRSNILSEQNKNCYTLLTYLIDLPCNIADLHFSWE